ncbi:dihydrodipicolinate synthase [Trichoderma cornu-damae]|uniref:Dihydrodipicolinate synthase n=1 Tax=Trichoderma cornu-damae TaxID=654480 RepID=A0A9P8QIQ2_9HYPO|nr:dihydrodipicolinate synthase [Trichoderma cornu-damae]
MSPSACSAAEAAANGSRTERPARALIRGVYVPTVAFFDPETEELDVKAVSRHAVRLAKAGVAGLAVQGSNGEAVHLTHDERSAITRTTRAALDAAGFSSMPLIVGCGAQSVVEAVSLCRAAAADGGDYALVLPPSYYAGLFDGSTVESFFGGVADASPIPIIIYNYPGATPAVDMDSDTLIRLSRHANIAGCKFTCGNTGKLGRVAAAAARASGRGFLCFAGSVDFTLAALASGASGVIGGLANVSPRAAVKLLRLAEAGADKAAEAAQLQAVLAAGDWVAIQTGVVGVKAALQAYFGYGGWARRPLPRPDEAKVKDIVDGMKEMMDVEKALPDVA